MVRGGSPEGEQLGLPPTVFKRVEILGEVPRDLIIIFSSFAGVSFRRICL